MSAIPSGVDAGSLRLRAARADDVEQLARIHSASFPDERSREVRRRLFVSNARGTLDDLLVVEAAGGELCAHAFLFRTGLWLGGREVPCAAIASLAVAPVHRGCGVASWLAGQLHERALARGDAVALLYPFKHAFYAAQGYGLAARVLQLRTRTRSLPGDLPGARPLVALTADDQQGVRALYAACCAKTSGMLSRPERLWGLYFADEARHWAVLRSNSGAIDAALSYGFAGASSETDGPVLRVHDHFARDATGRASILAFLARQRDHCATVELALAEGDPLPFALREPAATGARKSLVQMQPIGTALAGAMLRVLSLGHALRARGYLGDGALDVELLDARRSGAARERVRLEVRAGEASVSPAAGGSVFRTDRATFAGVYTGAVSPAAAVSAGLADVDGGDEALAIAQRVFALPPPHMFDAF